MYLIKKKLLGSDFFFFYVRNNQGPVSEIIPGIIKTSSNNCLILGHDFW